MKKSTENILQEIVTKEATINRRFAPATRDDRLSPNARKRANVALIAC